MARPLRPDFDGAYHHVMARGNKGEDIFHQEVDREDFIAYLGDVCDRYGWSIYAFTLMSNHYHLLVHTPKAQLSNGMKDLNSYHTRRMNWRYETFGHIFQGRFKSLLIEDDSYLLEVIRYIAMNPVAAGLAAKPGDWPWSSYTHQMNGHGAVRSMPWLETSKVLALTSSGKRTGRNSLAEFVTARSEVATKSRQRVKELIGVGGHLGKTGKRILPETEARSKRAIRRDGMARDAKSGMSQTEIAQKWKVSRSSVQRAIAHG